MCLELGFWSPHLGSIDWMQLPGPAWTRGLCSPQTESVPASRASGTLGRGNGSSARPAQRRWSLSACRLMAPVLPFQGLHINKDRMLPSDRRCAALICRHWRCQTKVLTQGVGLVGFSLFNALMLVKPCSVCFDSRLSFRVNSMLCSIALVRDVFAQHSTWLNPVCYRVVATGADMLATRSVLPVFARPFVRFAFPLTSWLPGVRGHEEAHLHSRAVLTTAYMTARPFPKPGAISEA